jgi:hypothetical protein
MTTLGEQDQQILDDLANLTNELHRLINNPYWDVTKEYWKGLLQSSLLSVQQTLEDLTQ